MKQTKNFLLMGAIALGACVFSACGGSSNSAEAEAAALPTDGILGELPKAVAEFEAAEAAASAKYDELRQTDRDKASEFWTDYLAQGNATKFKKETLPAIEKTLEGKEIPAEVAEGLPLRLDKNLTLDAKRSAETTGVFTADANKDTQPGNYVAVAFAADGQAIAIGKNIDFSPRNYPVAEGKPFKVRFFISPKAEDAAGWAHLQKIVILDKTTDAYKQAEEQVKATKEAFKNKGKVDK